MSLPKFLLAVFAAFVVVCLIPVLIAGSMSSGITRTRVSLRRNGRHV